MKELLMELLDCKKSIDELREKMESLESELMGKELIYQGNHASVMFVGINFQTITLYVENEEGENWEVCLSADELLDCLS